MVLKGVVPIAGNKLCNAVASTFFYLCSYSIYWFYFDKQVILKAQHTGRLFAFLAGLIIMAHAVVPHHHHFEIVHSSEQESTCKVPDQEKIPENPETHCHALNILASERTTNSSSNKLLSEYFSFQISGINGSVEFPPVKKVTATIFGHQSIFLKQFLSATQSLRGPPEIA